MYINNFLQQGGAVGGIEDARLTSLAVDENCEGAVHDHETHNSLGDDVKNGAADGLGVGADSAGAFGHDPDDGVEEPRDDGDVHDAREDLLVLRVNLVLHLAEEDEDGDEDEDGEAEEGP